MKYSLRNNCPVQFFDLPLWSVAIGPDEEKGEKSGTAKGIIAIGDKAIGVIAIGYLAQGVLSFGVVSVGLFSIGIFSLCLSGVGILTLGAAWARGCLAASLYRAAGIVSVGYDAVGSVAFSINSLF